MKFIIMCFLIWLFVDWYKDRFIIKKLKQEKAVCIAKDKRSDAE